MTCVIYTRENEEELSSRREREIQSSIAAKERYKKASRDRQMLMKEVQLLEIKLKRALEKRLEIMQRKM